MEKLEIVLFHNNTYGIRKRSSFLFGLVKTEKFVDLKSPRLCWQPGSQFFKDCQCDSLDEVTETYKSLSHKVKSVLTPPTQ